MEYRGFVEKMLSRLDRLDREQVESFVTRLLREFDLLKAVLDLQVDGVVVTDIQGRVEYLNHAARHMLDQEDRRRGPGDAWQTLLRGEAYRNLRTTLEEFYRDRNPVERKRVAVHRNRMLTYELSLEPVEVDGVWHAAWILHDVAKRERRREEEARARYVQFLATLTAGLAHEIRNPLNSLSIHSSLIDQGLKEGASELSAGELKRLRHSSEVLTEEIERLNRIVDQFLTAARPVKLDLQPTRVEGIFMQVAQLIGPECRQRGIELEIHSDPDLPPVPLDQSQMYQVVLNLAKNSMEAVDRDGKIELRSHLETDHVLIEVSDTGPGIPESDRAKIFEPYYSTKKTGSGLGLMVVWRIVKAHGGAIAVDSREGEGTTFSLALPLDTRPVRLLPGRAIVPERTI